MQPTNSSRVWCLLLVVGLVGGAWLLGGCGSETTQPNQPNSSPPSSVKPSERTPPAQPSLTPEQPSTVPPSQPPEEKSVEKPETKPTPPVEEKTTSTPTPAEKEKPAQPSTKTPEPKQEPKSETISTEEARSGQEDRSPTAKISSYAPADDLEAQMDQYLKDLQEAVASEDAFKDAEGKLSKDANTLIVLALALALHDQPNKYQKAGPAMMEAAKQLAAAKDFNAAKKAVEALLAAATSQGDPSTLKWEKVAQMDELMKAVPLISNKIKDSSLTRARLEKRGKDYAGYAAVLAVIAHGSLPNASETEKPTEVEKWQQFCIEMRCAAGQLNAALRAKDAEAALKANERLRKSCDDCHAVFHTQPTTPQE